MSDNGCRQNAKMRMQDMVSRLRGYADKLEKLSSEIDNLSPEAEEALWQLACGNFSP